MTAKTAPKKRVRTKTNPAVRLKLIKTTMKITAKAPIRKPLTVTHTAPQQAAVKAVHKAHQIQAQPLEIAMQAKHGIMQSISMLSTTQKQKRFG